MKSAKLKNPEDYPAGPSVHTPGAVGSIQQPRKGRTPFTAEDDRILAEWVRKAERNGAVTRGNELYRELELTVSPTYLNFPLHSYRTDRVVRIVGTLPNHGVTVGSSMSP